MLKLFEQLVVKPMIASSFSTLLARQRCLVLGAYESLGGVECTELSPVVQKLDDKLGGKMREALNGLPAGTGRLDRVETVTDASPKFPQIAVAGLGSKDAVFNEFVYPGESISTATGLGARELQKMGECVDARDTRCMKIHNFYNLLSLGASSVEPPMFLEHNYCSDPIPSTNGQGTTINNGGLCHEMMRADMASAAFNLGAFKAVAAMRLPINMRAFKPLYEKLVSGNAMKVGDALRINDPVLRTENAQNHSQLLMAEVLTYATKDYSPKLVISRPFSTSLARQRGLVLGAYESLDGVERTELSPVGQKLDDKLGGKLREALSRMPAGIGRLGRVVTVTDVSPEFPQIAVIGLGYKDADFNVSEFLYEGNVNIRTAAGLGARTLQKSGVQDIAVEGFNKPVAAAEGATLGVWHYTDKEVKTKVSLYEGGDPKDWEQGVIMADSQNWVRCLCETPAKDLTARNLASWARDLLCPYGVFVYARDRVWMETRNFKFLLNLDYRSVEPPIVLELNYCNDPIPSTGPYRPYLLIGQGTTFNGGGLGHEMMHADIAPAAIILGVFKAVAAMRLPINMRAIIPLYEYMEIDLLHKSGDMYYWDNIVGFHIQNKQDRFQIITLMKTLNYAKKVYTPKLVDILGTVNVNVTTKPDEPYIDPIMLLKWMEEINKPFSYNDVHKSNDVSYLDNELFTGTHVRQLILKYHSRSGRPQKRRGVPETSDLNVRRG